jgi:hypothetical protein
MSMPAIAAHAQDSLAARLCIVAENWKTIFQDGGITVYSQKVPVSDVLAFRAAAVLDAPVEQVMEVLRRVEITDEWMPDIQTKYSVVERSDFEAITYSINDLPWPFADRELVLLNRLRLDRLRKYLVVDVYSVDLGDVPVGKGNVRAHMYCGETKVRPAGEDRTEVDLILFVDPKGFIPAWLVNLFQKKLPYNFLKALEQKAATTSYPLRPSFQPMLAELRSLLE